MGKKSHVNVVILTFALAVLASGASGKSEKARFRLENLRNELELLERNRLSRESDRARLDRTIEAVRLWERIPVATGPKPELRKLKQELKRRAQGFGVRLVRIEPLESDRPARALPLKLHSDDRKFRLEPSQLVRTSVVKLVLRGEGPNIEDWIQTWPQDQVRLIAPVKGYAKPGLHPAGPGLFTLRAKVFEFREVRFPRLEPRDPLELIPEKLARQDPGLWQQVQEIWRRIPASRAYYREKERFLLDSARLSFFLSQN